MDEIEILRRYAAGVGAMRRRRAVDVTARVLESIRAERRRPDWLAGATAPMVMAAAASLLVAVTLGVLAQQAVAELQDPLIDVVYAYFGDAFMNTESTTICRRHCRRRSDAVGAG